MSSQKMWFKVFESISKTRDKRALFYKPACLWSVLEMIDDGLDPESPFNPDEIIDSFRTLVEPVFPERASNGWMPLWHLQSDRAWVCMKEGNITDRSVFPATKPKSRSQLLEHVSDIRMDTQLAQELSSQESRNQFKSVLVKMMLCDNDLDAIHFASYLAERLSSGSDDASRPQELSDSKEDEIQRLIEQDTNIETTEKDALITARRGQGRYRRNLELVEKSCRVTGVSDKRLLRASHIKPWRDCSNNHERLDGNNGLLLTPNIDLLFDQGYITFNHNGDLMLSPLIDIEQIEAIGLSTPKVNIGKFNSEQDKYLAYHREYVFKSMAIKGKKNSVIV